MPTTLPSTATLPQLIQAVNDIYANTTLPTTVVNVAGTILNVPASTQPQRFIYTFTNAASVNVTVNVASLAAGTEVIFKDNTNSRTSANPITMTFSVAVDGALTAVVDGSYGSVMLVSTASGAVLVGAENLNPRVSMDNLSFFNANIDQSMTVASNENALSVGPVSVNGAAVVTVEPGSRWVIL